ncbi:hypothetical protein C7271_16535 [filamentous cyanobacterium CCP5]|nr:hypothetical protein C7271_16535 [filamentous cyanobacterium CCP5]
MSDVFISYSRRDTDFATKLHQALVKQDYSVWIDSKNIPVTAAWREEIKAGIENADNFIFIISPDSLESPYCQWEIDHAVKFNKRLIPLIYREGFEHEHVHPQISEIQWLPFTKGGNFEREFHTLLEAIHLDLEYVRAHTRLLQRAAEWNKQGRDDSFLLRDRELDIAEAWLEQSQLKSPIPTKLQRIFIATSQDLRGRLEAIEETNSFAKEAIKTAVIYHQPKLLQALLISFAVSTVVIILRLLGSLQSLELVAFDGLLRLRPPEERDEKIVVIEVTEDDIQDQLREADQGAGTLSDTRLNRLLEFLDTSSPRVIGLDFYRDFPTQLPELSERMTNHDRLIGICKVPETNTAGITARGVAPPAEIPANRVGFSDVLRDRDGVLRRHLLISRLSEEVGNVPCSMSDAFSLQLARYYLAFDENRNTTPEDVFLSEAGTQLFIDEAAIPRLDPATGPYQLETYDGYQVLLNYRKTEGGAIDRAFPRITLASILEGHVPPSTLQDKLVLIGIVANTARDFDAFETPYPTEAPGSNDLPGVILQAQMTSQLINHVLENRPLIWVWPFWGECLWIGTWALAGAIIGRHCRRRSRFGLVILLAFGTVTAACAGVMVLSAGLIPLVPSALSLIATGGGLITLAFRPAAKTAPKNSGSNKVGDRDLVGTGRR